MKLFRVTISSFLACVISTGIAYASPEEDRQAMRKYYETRFPEVAVEAHKDGVYAIDAGAREQWIEMEDFPPYEIAVDEGEELFSEPFANGKGYGTCFADEGAVKQNYPYFDEKTSQVVTLEGAVNTCRVANGEPALAFDGGEIDKLTSYIAYASRGHLMNVAEPATPAALKAYESGKQFYTTRRGHLNFACSSCHVQIVGNMLRAEKLSASLGHPTHWPVYRFKWQDVGSLHARFAECNSQVGALPFDLQSEAYRNLEYFLSYISNGLELNGPATRK